MKTLLVATILALTFVCFGFSQATAHESTADAPEVKQCNQCYIAVPHWYARRLAIAPWRWNYPRTILIPGRVYAEPPITIPGRVYVIPW